MLNASNSGAPLPVPVGGEACEGRKAFRFRLDFSLGLQYSIDLTQWIQQGTVKSVQSMYVDNSGGANALTFAFGGTLQQIIVPAGAQAYLPVLEVNPPVFTVSCTNALQVSNIQILNFFVPPFMWGQVQALTVASIDAIISAGRMNVRSTPQGLTADTDKSGSITAGGAGQILMAANAARTQWTLQNPSTATEILQYSKISIAGPWYDLIAAQGAGEDGSSIYQGTIWVIGATTGHAFTADEGTV